MDGQLVQQATRPEQQSAFKQITNWLWEAELQRRARGMSLMG